MKRLIQLSASRFLPPGPGFLPPASRSLPPGLGPRPRVWVLPPASRPSDLSCLRTNGNLTLIRRHDLHYIYRFLNLKKGERSITRANQLHSRQGNDPYLEDLLLQNTYDGLIPAITINQMKLHAHCSTSTTLLTGSGHDIQLISRVPPCSLKYIDASC
ncbi:hypothetical protein F2Q69_00023315 [Brassica cretica]|uniref:Uncharacterized protein n=1 Tax=Brassica cretica TaxID=69181 RepID=A0A8S9QJ02_BRACR|nr:hypothetical protein F2Q69_00023315 [Brassica cretica]